MGIDVQPGKSYARVLMEQIIERAPLSKRELQDITGFSWGLISKLTNEFADKGYIVFRQKRETEVGRKPNEFDINPNENYFVGVDFTNKGCLIVITDMKGSVVEQKKFRWKVLDRDSVLEQLFEELDEVFRVYAEHRILGIAYAAQGTVNVAQGIYVHLGAIPGWKDVPLRQLTEERYGVDVVLAHDPDCLMKCEKAFGVLKGETAENIILVNYSWDIGIGMSIVMNGQIYTGNSGKAGEIGYALIGDGEYLEGNCLMNYIVYEDIERHYQEQTKSSRRIPIEEIVARYDAGDEIAREEFRSAYRCIGRSIAQVNSFLVPEVIIVHIGECHAEDMLMDIIRQNLEQKSYNDTVVLKKSNLNRTGKAVGAALLVIEKVMSSLF